MYRVSVISFLCLKGDRFFNTSSDKDNGVIVSSSNGGRCVLCMWELYVSHCDHEFRGSENVILTVLWEFIAIQLSIL